MNHRSNQNVENPIYQSIIYKKQVHLVVFNAFAMALPPTMTLGVMTSFASVPIEEIAGIAHDYKHFSFENRASIWSNSCNVNNDGV